jgi:integrase
LNETAYRHLLAIRTDREMVFPFPHYFRTFYTHLHKLQAAAGIPKADHFGLHTLRRTLATSLAAEGKSGAAQFVLGHSAMATTEKHYIAQGGIVAAALDALPQPAAFALIGGAARTATRNFGTAPAMGPSCAKLTA